MRGIEKVWYGIFEWFRSNCIWCKMYRLEDIENLLIGRVNMKTLDGILAEKMHNWYEQQAKVVGLEYSRKNKVPFKIYLGE